MCSWKPRELFHDLAPAAHRAHRHPAADYLAERGEVRPDPVARLRAALGDAETGHYLVENEDCAVPAAALAQRLEESRRRQHEVHVPRHRLDDHAGDRGAFLVEQAPERRRVVVGQDEGVRGDLGRHAGGARVAVGEGAGARLDQQRVGMPVVAALELHDVAAAGEAAREAQRRHGGLRPGRDEAHELKRGHQPAECLGELHLRFGGRAEGQRARRRFLHRFHHCGVGVADDHRTPRADVVHIASALGIPDVGARGALQEGRRAAHRAERAHRRIDAGGDDAPGALEERIVAHAKSSA